MPTAFSYLRFSSPEQAKGDSIRRQTEATAAWCERNKVTLDTSLSLRDEGVSAFRGKNRENPDVHGMAVFLAAVKSGRVPPGSFLILENLDRLTRESIVPATHLFTGLLMAGVKVVQLRPVEQVFTAGADMTGVMLALVELSRGNSESAMKSERVGAAWNKKRKNASAKIVTRRVPTWIAFKGDKLAVDPNKAKVVRRVFSMATEGTGLTGIARTLNVEKVPLLGRTTFKGESVTWSASLVHRLLTSRATIGEYQPHRGRPGDRAPDGAVIRDYYPPVVTRDEFTLAQAALRGRAATGRGRRGKSFNLFAGILRDARSGGTLMARHHTETEKVKRASVIVPANAVHGRGGKWSSFPLVAFEQALLSKLVEVTVEELGDGKPRVNKAEGIRARLNEVEVLVKKWKAKMDRPELVDAVAEKLAALEVERKELTAVLSKVEMDEATPLADSIGQLRTVGKALEKDGSEEGRLRARSAIRGAVESIWCLFLPGKGTRVAAVQVWFKGGARRDYLISCKPGMANATFRRPVEWSVSTFATAGLPALDLRKPADASRLEKALLRALPVAGVKV